MFVPDGEKHDEITGEKWNLNLFYEKFRGTKSNDLVSMLFFGALAIFFGVPEEVAKNLLTELHKNLLLKAFSA